MKDYKDEIWNFEPLKFHCFLFEANWIFVPNLMNFPPGVSVIICSQKMTDRQPKQHNAFVLRHSD